MRSLFRAANILITLFPASFIALIIGNIGATPTPPPAHITVPYFSIWVAWPNGPTTSVKLSPTSRAQISRVLKPTACTTSVIVPRRTSASAIVNGIRSPLSPRRTITKWPARRDLAIIGASTSRRTTLGLKYSFSTISNISIFFARQNYTF